MQHFKEFLKEKEHYLLLLYPPIYLFFFAKLEKMPTDSVHIISHPVDSMIPFVEIFVVPYLLWFFFIAGFGVFFFFAEKESFKKMMYFEMIGMTFFLCLSYCYPNGLELRPEYFERSNIFIDLVKIVYAKDTSTNVLPSIHVYNSLGVLFTVKQSKRLNNHIFVQEFSFVMTVLIVLSTMFIKQHSIVDVALAFVLSYMSWTVLFQENLPEVNMTRNKLSAIK